MLNPSVFHAEVILLSTFGASVSTVAFVEEAEVLDESVDAADAVDAELLPDEVTTVFVTVVLVVVVCLQTLEPFVYLLVVCVFTVVLVVVLEDAVVEVFVEVFVEVLPFDVYVLVAFSSNFTFFVVFFVFVEVVTCVLESGTSSSEIVVTSSVST